MVDKTIQTDVTSPAAPANAELPKTSWVKTALSWLPYVGGIVTGYYAFDVEVKKSIYRNVAKHHYFDDMQAVRNRDYEAALQRGKGDKKSIANELHAIEEKYRDEVSTVFRDKLGMDKIWHYWQGIQRNQKISAMVMGATVTSIIVGAVLLVNENDKLKEAFARKDREDAMNRRV